MKHCFILVAFYQKFPAVDDFVYRAGFYNKCETGCHWQRDGALFLDYGISHKLVFLRG